MNKLVNIGQILAKITTPKEVNKGMYIAFSLSYPPTFPAKIPPRIIPAAGAVATTKLKEDNLTFFHIHLKEILRYNSMQCLLVHISVVSQKKDIQVV